MLNNNYNIINMNEISFNKMVDNAYQLMEINKKKKIILPNMDIEIESNRLYWKNVECFLKLINRCPDHFLNFLKYEFNNKDINWLSALSIKDGLIIHQKYPKLKALKDMINKYIEIFVICSSCNSYNTLLNKFISKKYQFICSDCGMNKCI